MSWINYWQNRKIRKKTFAVGTSPPSPLPTLQMGEGSRDARRLRRNL